MEELLREMGVVTDGSLYDASNATIVHHVNQALKAHKLFQRDKDYIVRNDEVVIIDEFTGRMMPGRRFSEGLHQALEAKERVTVQPENVTLASITFQNYFRLYKKLSGMTGTAATEAEEFGQIYNLEVVEIPTNKPVSRLDEHDEVYRSYEEKLEAISNEIAEASTKMQPMLVGTTSIEKSEQLADYLVTKGWTMLDVSQPDALQTLYKAAREGTPSKLFTVLNARFHEQEAYIVAEAGVPGAVTVATNMAGRGTDIQLGGNVEMRVEKELGDIEAGPERDAREAAIRAEVADFRVKAKAAGGLYIIGTERHESRRIDNQLRGRAGRQGDEGRSKFYLSLKDDLMRIFGSDRMENMLVKLGLKDGEAIVHPWINKALEKAQQKVEARNFDMRKNILKYDDVMNDQRKVVFEQRREMMASESLEEQVKEMREGVVDDIVARYIPRDAYPEQWDIDEMTKVRRSCLRAWRCRSRTGSAGGRHRADEEMTERLQTGRGTRPTTAKIAEERPRPAALRRKAHHAPGARSSVARASRDGSTTLRQVIGLRGYGAEDDPLNEYKREAFAPCSSELIGDAARACYAGCSTTVEIQLRGAAGTVAPNGAADVRDPAVSIRSPADDDPRSWIRRLGTSPTMLPINGAARARCGTPTALPMPARWRPIRMGRHGLAATRRARAARARSSSTATAR